MSMHFYVELDRTNGELNPNSSDRVALVRYQEQLVKICSDLQVKPLSEFYSYDTEVLSELLGEEEIEIPEAPKEWFDATEALPTVRALIEFLSTSTLNLPVEQVIPELNDLERILEWAATNKVKFRCYVGF